MQASTHQSLVWRARIIAGSCGVTVIEDPSATTFRINEKGVLTVPVLSDAPDEIAILNKGGTLHEALHFSDSDFDAVRDLSPLERQFMMVFEDYRIERVGCHRFKGAHQDLRDMWAALYAMGKVSRHDSSSDDLLYGVGVLCLSFCRARLFDLPEAHQDAGDCRTWLSGQADEKSLADVDHALSLLDSMTCTRDAVELARRVIINFVHPDSVAGLPATLQPGSESHQVEDQSSCDDPKNGESQPQDQTATQPDVGGNESLPSGDSGNGSGQQQSAAPGRESLEGGCSPDAEDAEDFLPSPLGDAFESDGSLVEVVPDAGSTAAAPIEHVTPAINAGALPLDADGGELVAQAIEQYLQQLSRMSFDLDDRDQAPLAVLTANQVGAAETILVEAQRDTLSLRPGLQQLLRAISQDREVPARSGRIDPRRLWKLRVGDLKVFTRHIEAPTPRVHLHIMLDASWSMREARRLEFGKRLQAAIGLSVDGLNRVACSWSAFQGGDNAGLHILKRTGESTHLGCGRLATLRADGGTPLGPALKSLQGFLMREPADRTIVMIGTDGEPDSLSSAKNGVRSLRASGVDVCVFGIQTSAAELDADALYIMQPADMAPQLFGWLETRLKSLLAEAA